MVAYLGVRVVEQNVFGILMELTKRPSGRLFFKNSKKWLEIFENFKDLQIFLKLLVHNSNFQPSNVVSYKF